MKKIITLSCFLSLFIFSSGVFAQSPHPFELGFNGGVSWLKSDVKMKKLGGGFGLTFGQTYCLNSTSPLLWGWRFRYLYANTYGQDYKPSYGLKNNTVLNGETDTLLDYEHNNGYVYQNYKTHLDELSLELLIGANKLRVNTGFYPYIFGGIGFTKAVAKTDQLNDKNERYNYASVDSTGTAGKSEIKTRLNNMSDGTYETLADGNRNPRWKLMPSLGIGIGYEIVKGVSIGIEHKITWGLNDVLDGQRWSATNTTTGNNDMYHYTSVWLKFGFGRAAKNTSPHHTTPETTYTPAPVPLPTITFTNPDAPNVVTNQPTIVVTGIIANIASGSDMGIMANGAAVPGFTYNSETHAFSCIAPLQNGPNTFVVSASNPAGTVNASTTVMYEPPVILVPVPANQSPLPVVNITMPVNNPYVTNAGTVSVIGTIEHILNKSQVRATINGEPVHGLSYNAPAHSFIINSGLMPGANTFVITATNPAGDDTKATTIIFQQETVIYNAPKPEIRIVAPLANPYNTNANTVNVSATVYHVESRNAITVIVNGYPNSGFTYDLSNGVLNFAMPLINGANTIQIQAVNEAGTDSKTGTIIYTPVVVAVPKPVITITNPGTNPYTTISNAETVTATVLNITSASQVSATINGSNAPMGALSYNASSHGLTLHAGLISGNNSIVITATNASGSDSQTQTIIYSKPTAVAKPIIMITRPEVNPFYTGTATATMEAIVMYITSVSQIAVTQNGIAIPAAGLSFNAAGHLLTFNVTLVSGANTMVIKASNTAGSDSKSEVIVYSLPVITPPPVMMSKPVITIVNPATSSYSTSSATLLLQATITDIASVSDLSVMLNGAAMPAATLNYNAATHQLETTVNLAAGSNSLRITASNTSGNSFKMLSVTRTAAVAPTHVTAPTTAPVITPAPAPLPGTSPLVTPEHTAPGRAATETKAAEGKGTAGAVPVITLETPATTAVTTSDAVYTITAAVANVPSGGITVKINGTAFNGFLFVARMGTLSIPVTLNVGANVVEITATNAYGNKTETVTITK